MSFACLLDMSPDCCVIGCCKGDSILCCSQCSKGEESGGSTSIFGRLGVILRRLGSIFCCATSMKSCSRNTRMCRKLTEVTVQIGGKMLLMLLGKRPAQHWSKSLEPIGAVYCGIGHFVAKLGVNSPLHVPQLAFLAFCAKTHNFCTNGYSV
jgi:hypothetical protein